MSPTPSRWGCCYFRPTRHGHAVGSAVPGAFSYFSRPARRSARTNCLADSWRSRRCAGVSAWRNSSWFKSTPKSPAASHQRGWAVQVRWTVLCTCSEPTVDEKWSIRSRPNFIVDIQRCASASEQPSQNQLAGYFSFAIGQVINVFDVSGHGRPGAELVKQVCQPEF